MGVMSIGVLVIAFAFLVGCVPVDKTTPVETAQIDAASATLLQSTALPSDSWPDTPVASISNRPFVEIYKTIDGIQLEAHIFFPPDHKQSEMHPAFVFFHGGGWFEGEPENGYRLSEHWASRGMVAVAFEYRLADFDSVSPSECVTDAKSAIRWLRIHAQELGIDPDKIVVTGGSAGGHLAISTAMLEGKIAGAAIAEKEGCDSNEIELVRKIAYSELSQITKSEFLKNVEKGKKKCHQKWEEVKQA